MFRALVSLLHTKGIVRAKAALVPGVRHATEAARDPARCRVQVVTEGFGEPLPGVGAIVLARGLFREIDVWGTGPPLLVVDVPEMPRWDQREWPAGCTVIIPLQDPRNVGAALRSAAAFGAAAAILTAEAAHPFHPEAVRPAAGTQGTVPLFKGATLTECDHLPRPLLVLDKEGIPLRRLEWPVGFGLLVGMEGPGLPGPLHGVTRIAIPIHPAVDSLNAATALAVALYEWSRARET